VLKIISRSSSTFRDGSQPLVETEAASLQRPTSAHMLRRRDDLHNLSRWEPLSEEAKKFRHYHCAPDLGTYERRVCVESVERSTSPIVLADSEYTYLERIKKLADTRHAVGIPLLPRRCDRRFVVAAAAVEPFTNKEIEAGSQASPIRR